MAKIKIAVIFGGKSTEHEVSNVSGTSVISNLDKEKYEIFPIYIDKNGEWHKYTENIEKIHIFEIGEEPKKLEKIGSINDYLKSMDVIFPVLHGLYGEDGTIQGMFELAGVPYVGCKVLASSVCMDKVYSKIIFEKAKINQTKYVVLKHKENNIYAYVDDELNEKNITLDEILDKIEEKIKYPMFVKPSNSGSSVGINKAENKKELKEAIEFAKDYDFEIIVEQGINGKEVECAVLEEDGEVKASCVGQILSAEEFYSYSSKYTNVKSQTLIPADISVEKQEEIRALAVKAFKAVLGNGISRVDFFVENETNKVYINEINTMPGFTKISMYPQLWEKCGLLYSNLLNKLIQTAMKK